MQALRGDEQLLRQVRAARDDIDRRYALPVALGDLAREAAYSRLHFARAFRRVYGETPGMPYFASVRRGGATRTVARRVGRGHRFAIGV